jgi:hypothetical protein
MNEDSKFSPWLLAIPVVVVVGLIVFFVRKAKAKAAMGRKMARLRRLAKKKRKKAK